MQGCNGWQNILDKSQLTYLYINYSIILNEKCPKQKIRISVCDHDRADCYLYILPSISSKNRPWLNSLVTYSSYNLEIDRTSAHCALCDVHGKFNTYIKQYYLHGCTTRPLHRQCRDPSCSTMLTIFVC